jgi:hypothetical protein
MINAPTRIALTALVLRLPARRPLDSSDSLNRVECRRHGVRLAGTKGAMKMESWDSHPRFRRLVEYLAAKAPPGKLAGRQHIDPLEIPDLLPYLMLIDVVPQQSGEPRYRIRLVGTDVVAAIQGQDGTGKFVEEVLTGAEGAEIIRRYGEILHDRRPQHRRGVVATPGRDHVAYERVAFPLARDGEHVDMLICVFVR